MPISSDRLAYWYLRLNGFLTIENFIVHPERGTDQRTDADIIGVRFPYRAELGPDNPMEDDRLIPLQTKRPLLIIAEVKLGICSLNGPWTRRTDENMQRVLRSIGACPEDETEQAAAALYEDAAYSARCVDIRLACFGRARNADLAKRYADLLQVTWADALRFVHGRFRRHRHQKKSHGQWKKDGKYLWDTAMRYRSLKEFQEAIEITT